MKLYQRRKAVSDRVALPLLRGMLVMMLAAVVPLHALSQILIKPEQKPAELKEVGLEEKLNGQIDLNLTFRDETGKVVALKDYFAKGRPVVLNLVYYSCPMLCGMVLQGVVRSLKGLPYTPGTDIEVISVSFNEKEQPELAKAKKESILQEYARPGADVGWHVLVDNQGNVKKLADQIGFSYKWDPESQQFAHPSVTTILTPEGKISRYLTGIDYEPRNMRLALTEASQGKIGTVGDRFMLYCYKYDPSSRSYVMAATRTMRLGGVLIVLLLGGALYYYWRRELKGQGGSRDSWDETPGA